MKKRVLMIVAVILAIIFCEYVGIAAADLIPERVVQKTNDIISPILFSNAGDKLPDLMVEYKKGTATVKTLPRVGNKTHGMATEYSYEPGSNGVFWAMARTEHPYEINDFFDMARLPFAITAANTTAFTAIDLGVNFEKRVLRNGTLVADGDGRDIYKSDGSKLVLNIKDTATYSYHIDDVEYCEKTKQYSAIFSRHKKISDENQNAQLGVALFDESGKIIKKFLLTGLYKMPILGNSNPMTGVLPKSYSMYFASGTDTLYINSFVTKKAIDVFNNSLLVGDWSEDWDDSCFDAQAIKIDLKSETYTEVSQKEYKNGIKPPKLPFYIEYNKYGTQLYTVDDGVAKNLATLRGDYIAVSYSINNDGSCQVIFASDNKRGADNANAQHPLNMK